MTNMNDDQVSVAERGDVMILLECVMSYGCYAVVCCVCHKTLELKGTTEEHMLWETSHTYCEKCGEAIMAEAEQV